MIGMEVVAGREPGCWVGKGLGEGAGKDQGEVDGKDQGRVCNILDISTKLTQHSHPPLILASNLPLILTITLPQPLTNPTTRLPTSNNIHTNHRTITTSTNRTKYHNKMNATLDEEEEETEEDKEDINSP